METVKRDVRFNEEAHVYTVDGKRMPGINEILESAGITRGIPDIPAVKAAVEKGTIVHKYLELLDTNQLGCYEVDANVQPYINAWGKFLGDSPFELCRDKVEYLVYNEELRYCTRIDRVMKLEGELVTVNIKTGRSIKHYSVQSAAEAMAIGARRRCSVYLSEDGNFNVEEYRDCEDEEVFRAAVKIYDWKKGR